MIDHLSKENISRIQLVACISRHFGQIAYMTNKLYLDNRLIKVVYNVFNGDIEFSSAVRTV